MTMVRARRWPTPSLPPAALLLLVLFAPFSVPARAQTVDDGVMMSKRSLFAGDMYSHESWDRYWEGTLKRVNGNIGTVVTEANVWFANYGVTDRLNVIATVPHVWTRASQGALHPLQGFQDITLAAKYSVLERPSTRLGRVRAIAVVTGGIPLTDYTPDFAPLSIGSGSRRVSGRFTLHVQSEPGWYVTGSTAHTWRADVSLDRPYYYTDDQFVLSDQVDMPNVFDYVVSGGYMTRGLMAAGFLSEQRTLGGGDIRRQDVPFVSNRMNFSKIGGMVMTPVPMLHNVAFHFAYAFTLAGRNVGQATTVTAGFSYSLPFQGRTAR